jgi:predicted Zn-dependent peptidase
VFGASHRYGRPEGGDAAQIAAFGVADLRAFHAAPYVPAASTLVVVGDVTRAVLPRLETALGSWRTAGVEAPPPVTAPLPLKRRTVWLVDKPGAAQSAIRVGGVGPSWNAPGYAATEVMNTQVARKIVDQVVYDLPRGFFEEFVPKALAVDVAALQASARSLVDPARMAVVVVGDAKTVEAPLRALGLGAMRTLTVDEVMGPVPKVD